MGNSHVDEDKVLNPITFANDHLSFPVELTLQVGHYFLDDSGGSKNLLIIVVEEVNVAVDDVRQDLLEKSLAKLRRKVVVEHIIAEGFLDGKSDDSAHLIHSLIINVWINLVIFLLVDQKEHILDIKPSLLHNLVDITGSQPIENLLFDYGEAENTEDLGDHYDCYGPVSLIKGIDVTITH